MSRPVQNMRGEPLRCTPIQFQKNISKRLENIKLFLTTPPKWEYQAKPNKWSN
jgi:hypothetical protein